MISALLYLVSRMRVGCVASPDTPQLILSTPACGDVVGCFEDPLFPYVPFFSVIDERGKGA